MRRTRQCRTPHRERCISSARDRRSTDPNSHVAVAAGIPLPAAIVAVGVDGAAVEGKAAKTAVEACAVKAAAMEGERTSAAAMEGERTSAAAMEGERTSAAAMEGERT